MSFGQAPFTTNYSANSISLINVGSEETANESDLITFIKGSAGNGKRLYVDSTLLYNPNANRLTSTNIVATQKITTNALLSITDQTTTTNAWDIGSALNGTLYFNYPTSFVDILQLKATGTLQINGSASAFRAIDRTNTARYMAWYANNNTLFWEYYDGATTSNFMTYTTSNDTLNLSTIKPTNITDVNSSNGTTGQYLTKGASGIAWNTLPTIPTVNNGTLTISTGTYLTGSTTFSANQSANSNITISTNAVSTNTASTLVARDASGNFAGNIITAFFLSASSATVYGTLAVQNAFGQVVFNDRDLSGNTFSIYADSSILNIKYNSTTPYTIDSTGVTTLVPQKIQTTAQTTGTFYLNFVPLSTTQNLGQVVSVHSALSYNVATSNLTVANITGTASVATRAVNVGTTLTTTAASFYIGFVPSNTTSTSQALNVATALSYNPSTQTLTAPFITGTATGAGAIAVSSLISTTYYPTMSLYNSTNTSPSLLYVDTGIAYISGGRIELRGTTNTYRFFDRSLTTRYAGVFLNSNVITFNWFNGTTLTNIFTFSTATTPVFSGSTTYIQTTSAAGIDYNYTIPFVVGVGTQSLTIDDAGYQPLYNPSTATVKVTNLNINSTLLIYDTINTANYWTISSANNILYYNNTWSAKPIPLIISGDNPSVSAYNLAVAAYTNTTGIELETPNIVDYNYGNGLSSISLTTGDYSGYATETQPTSTTSGAFYTFTVQAYNPNNKILLVSFPVNQFCNFTRSSGTFAIDVTVSSLDVTMTRNGVSFTNFAYEKPAFTAFRYTMTSGTSFNNVQQPLFQLNIYINTTDSTVSGIPSNDTYIIKVDTRFTSLVFSGAGSRTVTAGTGGYKINAGTTQSTPSTGFTFSTTDAIVTALAISKSQADNETTMSPNYLNTQYINLTYQRTFTTVTTAYEPLCFSGSYLYYDITINFTVAPTAYATLTFGLADSIGTKIITNYAGRASVLGATYITNAWAATGAIIGYLPATTNNPLKWTISRPNSAFRKVINGTNNCAYDATNIHIPVVTSGVYTVATAYTSCWWTITGTTVSGTIIISGRNT